MIYMDLYIPGGDRRISDPSTVTLLERHFDRIHWDDCIFSAKTCVLPAAPREHSNGKLKLGKLIVGHAWELGR